MAKPFDDLLLTPRQRKVKELTRRAKVIMSNRRLPSMELAQNIIARKEGHITWKAMLEYLKTKLGE